MYRVGKSNQVADALHQWPKNPKSSSKSSNDDEEWETISYEMICQILNHNSFNWFMFPTVFI